MKEKKKYKMPITKPVGKKFSKGKRRWSLLPWKEIELVVDVLNAGAIKYDDNNWMIVPNAKEEYWDALHRHLSAWWQGERNDPEDNLHHLAHAMCNVIFLLWFDNNKVKK